MNDKWNFEMDKKTLNIYRNLSNQINKAFRHTRQGSIKTRHRYEDGMAITNDNEGIALLITDHLKWKEEYNHLVILQKKNKCLHFIFRKWSI